MTGDILSHEELSIWNDKQREEILGEDNRKFFFNAHGREPRDENELAFHYIKNGGAFGFDERNKKR